MKFTIKQLKDFSADELAEITRKAIPGIMNEALGHTHNNPMLAMSMMLYSGLIAAKNQNMSDAEILMHLNELFPRAEAYSKFINQMAERLQASGRVKLDGDTVEFDDTGFNPRDLGDL